VSYNIANLRLTVQATPRNKFTLFWDEQKPCDGATYSSTAPGCRQQPASGYIYGGAQSTIAPEAGGGGGAGGTIAYDNAFQRVQQGTWSSAVTSRFLLEARFGTYLQRYGTFLQPGDPTTNLVRMVEQCTAGCPANGNIPGLTYRSANFSNNWTGTYVWNTSASYVTGSHNTKVGYQGAYYAYEPLSFTNSQNLSFRVNNGVPNQLTETLLPFERQDRVEYAALYAQDSWTYRRMTLQAAVRFDHAWSFFPEQSGGPSNFLPTAIVFPETTGVSYNDITPRLGFAYDLFGNNKTSLKINFGKYLQAAAPLDIWSASNPVTRIATSATRSWTPVGTPGTAAYFTPQCDLTNPAANGKCAAISNQLFGTSTFQNSIDPNILHGWDVRPSDSQVGISVQQQLLPRVAVEAGYYRRWLDHFFVTDNLSVSAANFSTFNVTAPSDPRLPNGGGYAISGLYDVNPAYFGLVNNLMTSAGNFGGAYNHYNGFLLNVSARPRNGLAFQGGVNLGDTVSDNCAVRAQLPGLSTTATADSVTAINQTNPWCHVDTGWVWRVTGLTSYVIPRIDVQVSGTFRSDQGQELAANYGVPNSAVVPSLGRNLAGNAPNVTVNLIQPGTMYGDRVNEIDFRVAKVLKFGRVRTNVGLDLYNVLNSNAVLSYNYSFIPGGSWLVPNWVMTPRFLKISANVDF
jgi:hypothetical protein